MPRLFRQSIATVIAGLVITVVGASAPLSAQRSARATSPPLPTLPATFFTSELSVRVSAVATGLSHPWSLAFLPDGSMLVTERQGRLRIVRNGVLDPKPIEGVPPVFDGRLAGLLDIALHPRFADNRLIYLSYSKGRADKRSTTVLARARFTGTALVDLREIFVANTWSESETNYGGRLAFDRDGFLFLTIGERQEQNRAQNPGDHGGKVLRLRDDGSVPADNPFVSRPGYKPEIYSLGHRNPLGLAIHPVTGDLWSTEEGPQGGDELNKIEMGKNYGWPRVSLGRNYDGTRVGEGFSAPGLEEPVVFWVPAIAISGLSFYDGDKFPGWKGNALVGAMRNNTGQHIQRVQFNAKGEPTGREIFLSELKQRIREVKPGPDGNIYAITDETFGAVLKIEPGQ